MNTGDPARAAAQQIIREEAELALHASTHLEALRARETLHHQADEVLDAVLADNKRRETAARDELAAQAVGDFRTAAGKALAKYVSSGKPADAQAVLKLAAELARRCHREQGVDVSDDVFMGALFAVLEQPAAQGDATLLAGVQADARPVCSTLLAKVVERCGEDKLPLPGPLESKALLDEMLAAVDAFAARARYPHAARAEAMAMSLTNRIRARALDTVIRADMAKAIADAEALDKSLAPNDSRRARPVRGGLP